MQDDGILRFLTCGSVDDGKSTLIGHLLHLTASLHDDQLCLLEQESRRIGSSGAALDYSLLLDGLMAEREQGITIDVAHLYFATEKRKFIVADTPGHERYTRNMATGASRCCAALILVDATRGVLPQTRRHALICSLMGIRLLLFAVNKMDRVAWSESVFREAKEQCLLLGDEIESLSLPRVDCAVVPISALYGDNLASASLNMPWCRETTVLGWLSGLAPSSLPADAPLRLPVQHVIKSARAGSGWQHGCQRDFQTDASGTFRAYTGTLSSGTVSRGDKVAVLPSGITTTVERIWNGFDQIDVATAGMSVALTLAGEHDIVRGDCVVADADRPEIAGIFKVWLVWMDQQPLYSGRHYIFKGVSGSAVAEITRIRDIIGLDTLQRLPADRLSLNDLGEVELTLSRPIPFDPYHENRETGGFVLVDRLTNATVACGMIQHAMRRANNVHWQHEEVEPRERAAIKGQKPRLIWLTGLSGAGKTTIANCLERKFHDLGRHTMLLDGDNVRHGLNKDLGFTEADRVENIRRVGEVARLMLDAGLVVITAFISPFRSDRDTVRRIVTRDDFIEVFVHAPLEVCEKRDPKGLYRKARKGLIPNFTGISAPYEEPLSPEILLDTTRLNAEECAHAIIRYLETL